jgi:CTP synthase
MSKFVIIVGGVYSGTGKGIGAASLALLLKMRGLDMQYIKCDPYLNINAGTLAPKEHGEVFILNDGTEVDLDLGHIERITGIQMCKQNIFTSGILYKELLEEEEQGKHLGSSVQIVPHVINKIEQRLVEVSQGHDITIVEIGGTVGDFESAAFFESISQFKHKNPDDVLIIMVAPVIWNPTVKEFKTKPLQNAVRALRHDGLIPEILLCRCDREIPEKILDKISKMSGVHRSGVFEAPDVETIYQVPIEFYKRHVDDLIVDRFHIQRRGIRIHKYRELVERYVFGNDLANVTIGVVGKYDNCDEAYLSLKEAILHAGVHNHAKVKIEWINAELFEKGQVDLNVDGVIVPGGFDSRSVEGKIQAIKMCRERKIPFLGICLGLQCAVIEFARNVLGIKDANSQEFNITCENPVIHYVEGQNDKIKRSGTMRLGAYECELVKDSIIKDLYKKKVVSERHRHRFEVNNDYTERYEEQGFVVSGRNPQSGLVEMMELKKDLHPYFVCTQAHPEFQSRLDSASPLFAGLIQAAIERQLFAGI